MRKRSIINSTREKVNELLDLITIDHFSERKLKTKRMKCINGIRYEELKIAERYIKEVIKEEKKKLISTGLISEEIQN